MTNEITQQELDQINRIVEAIKQVSEAITPSELIARIQALEDLDIDNRLKALEEPTTEE